VDADALNAVYSAAGELKAREGILKFVAKSIALAALVLVTAGPSYAQPLRSTSIPSSLADDEKRLMPEVMTEFYGSFEREKACWISKHKVPTRSAKARKDDASVAHVVITHPDRVLWPDAGITKLELARYYEAIAPRLLAQAGDRPISLVRCPNASGGQCFFQRHVTDGSRRMFMA
jgi:hypothetical protein